SPLLWVGFLAVIALLLFFDLGVLDREPHGLTPREAIVRFVVWASLAALFCAGIWLWLGAKPALEFAAGYLLEESLSVDNIFVIVLVFKLFKVPGKFHHRVLFWGIVGAVVLRGAMILGGTALIHRFSWLLYVFGAFLIFTGIRFFFSK